MYKLNNFRGNKEKKSNNKKPSFDSRDRKSTQFKKSNNTHEFKNKNENKSGGIFEEIREDRLEGRNPVLEALKSGRTIEKILVSSGQKEGSILRIIAMAKDKRIIVQEVEREKLDSITQTFAHQGVIAYVSDYKYVEVDDILKKAKEKGEQPFIIILDEITDPHNLGSIIRSAEVSGAHGVIIAKRRSVGLTPAVAKASSGAIEYIDVAKVSNIAQTIEYLKKEGVWVVGADMNGEKVYFESDLKGPIAIVIGSEGEGIGQLIKQRCDFLVNIPMNGHISSLNASVAGGLLMFEVLRQRRNG